MNYKALPVNNYILKLCGLFSYNKAQRTKLDASGEWKEEYISPQQDSLAWKHLKNQYYPNFRLYLTNQKEQDFYQVYSCNKYPDEDLLYVKIAINGKEINYPFKIKSLELHLFDKSIGIYVLDIGIEKQSFSVADFSNYVNKLRNFNTDIFLENQKKHCWIDHIEDLINIHLNGELVNRINIHDESDVDNYSGSKLKVYQTLEVDEELIDGDTIDSKFKSLLFELGTVAPIGSVRTDDKLAPSPEYFEEVTSVRISVFRNWQSLALFDTFTTIGHNNLQGDSPIVWNHNYFRMYLFNLFSKYYLFYVNSKSIEINRLHKQREEFNDFLNQHQIDRVSYNFLPNIIHQNQKKSLEISEETDKLKNKIERINITINEKLNGKLNFLLIILAFLSIIPTELDSVNDFMTTQQDLNNLLFTLAKIILVLTLGVWTLLRNKA